MEQSKTTETTVKIKIERELYELAKKHNINIEEAIRLYFEELKREVEKE